MHDTNYPELAIIIQDRKFRIEVKKSELGSWLLQQEPGDLG